MLSDILNYTISISDLIIFVFLPYLCYILGSSIYKYASDINRKITMIATCAEHVSRRYERLNGINAANAANAANANAANEPFNPFAQYYNVPNQNQNQNQNNNDWFTILRNALTPSPQSATIFLQLAQTIVSRASEIYFSRLFGNINLAGQNAQNMQHAQNNPPVVINLADLPLNVQTPEIINAVNAIQTAQNAIQTGASTQSIMVAVENATNAVDVLQNSHSYQKSLSDDDSIASSFSTSTSVSKGSKMSKKYLKKQSKINKKYKLNDDGISTESTNSVCSLRIDSELKDDDHEIQVNI